MAQGGEETAFFTCKMQCLIRISAALLITWPATTRAATPTRKFAHAVQGVENCQLTDWMFLS